MKYVMTLFSLFFFFLILKCTAQSNVDFGIKGGLNLTFFKVPEAQFGNTIQTETGFYGGVSAAFEIDENVSLQPELLYIQLSDFKFLNAPIYAKFQLSDKLSFMAGPSLNYFFDFFTNKFKVRGDIATSYNITNALDVHMKFVVGFTEVAPNGLFIGTGYKF
ncbi:porin family protein [Psychroserpens luteus]|uniref:Outer membrane protein beta-barrel domain-containing protein n=1 Tax=Psychroserpens luteus TaxID=1434066 RepID=A0ABW5ZN43_9FLAO|nr:hypothetical protein [Psychroserpens luteus]